MSPDSEQNHQALRRIFDLALAAAPIDRAALLERECGGDAGLRERIEAMLAAVEDERFMAGVTADMHASEAARNQAAGDGAGMEAFAGSLRERPGTKIGPYKLLQQIGEGGFGSVFMAQQERPVQRKVALKIIKLGMDTAQVVSRFEQERQALAILDHPNIAKVFDAGATDTGRPYFVMELCTGEPIDAYCDRNSLSIPERLELFAQVCQAVQHAHTKGIIHRDIKPSNVLVASQDGKPHAKVIDFGIAKATASPLTERTLFTEHRQIIGTPEYMSPEQAEGSLDIDTRTDIYALGVMLYELLTGSTPFTSKELRSAAYAEIQRIIREVEPPNPSTRLSQQSDTLAGVAARRKTEPRKLGTLVRGELDWIVMKALEKDRARRYETANGLAMDIRRYLDGEAVVAAPPGAGYRLRKFVRRNRVPVAAGSAVGVALLLGLAGTAWQARVASQQRDAAVAAGKEVEAARDAERARAAELKQVSDFQGKMLTQLDPRLGGVRLTESVVKRFTQALEKAGVDPAERKRQAESFGREWAMVNATDIAADNIGEMILTPAVQAIDRQFAEQPAVNAQLRQAVSDVYVALGMYDQALPLAQEALAQRRKTLGDDHPDTIASMDRMGTVLLSQRKVAQAGEYYKESLERRRRVLGEDHPDTLASLGNIGVLYWAQNDLPRAEANYREVVEKMKRVRGKEDKGTLRFMTNLGVALKMQGKYAEAEAVVREALEIRRRQLGNENIDTLDSIMNMGPILAAQGKLAESELYYREALEISRHVCGEEHPDTLRAYNNVGGLLIRQKKHAEAEAMFKDVLGKSRRSLGPDHPDTLHRVVNLARAIMAQEKFAEALALLTEFEPQARKTLTGGYLSRRAIYLRLLANARTGPGFDAEQFKTAEGLLLEAQKIVDGPSNATDKEARQCLQALAELYTAWDQAEPGKGFAEKAQVWRTKASNENKE